MPIYVMLTNLTDEGRKTVQLNPERIKKVNQEVHEMGAKIIAQYALLGQSVFINVLDAPDSETIVRIAMDLGARGTMSSTTMTAITVDQFIDAMTT